MAISSDRAVLALGILAHDPEIDVARLAVGEWAGHALEQAHRAQVHVLVEFAADRDQQAPQRNVVRHAWPAHRAEEDALVLFQCLHAVVRHHLAGLGKAVAGPVEVGEFQLETEAAPGGFQHAHALRHDFLADSVTRNEGDLVLGHVFPLLASDDVY
jgi:hypothetical protein